MTITVEHPDHHTANEHCTPLCHDLPRGAFDVRVPVPEDEPEVA